MNSVTFEQRCDICGASVVGIEPGEHPAEALLLRHESVSAQLAEAQASLARVLGPQGVEAVLEAVRKPDDGLDGWWFGASLGAENARRLVAEALALAAKETNVRS